MHTKVNYQAILNRLQAIWALCFGMITAMAVIGFWLPHIFRPLFGLLLCLPVVMYNRKYVEPGSATCPHITVFTMYALVVSSIVILGIDIANSRITTLPLASANMRYFIPALIVYPVASITYAIALYRRNNCKTCRLCQERAGYTMRETLERNVMHNETKTLLWTIFALCTLVSVAVWLYFIFRYVDYNFTKTDQLVFIIIPICVYIISVVYEYSRISGMQFEILVAPGRPASEQFSMLRFLVIKNDTILLSQQKAGKIETGLWDTPYTLSFSYTDNYSADDARREFEKMSGHKDFILRELFVSNTASHNAFHYAIILPPESEDEPDDNAQWMGLYEIDKLMKTGHITRPFAKEIHRIYSVTMAWKTYDKEGKRLYPIRNYRPTFRIADFKDWKVDYGDPVWLDVANNNEDRPFFALRRFFRKHIAGVDR